MGLHSSNRFHPAYKGLRILGIAIIGLVTAVIFGLLFGFFVERIWNWLMPSLFKLGKITYWQAFALVILARLIFGSFGHSHGDAHHYPSHHYPRDRYPHRWHYYEYRKENLKDWQCYDLWWREEGKDAFENYLSKKGHEDEK